MNEKRLRQELAALNQDYKVHRKAKQVVDLTQVAYPSRWTPRTGLIRYALPLDYPDAPPTVHVPAKMTYHGEPNRRFKESQFNGWKRWCVYFNDWEPRRHTLVTVTRLMMGSLSDPSKGRLFTE